jgi:sulfoxide reductase heme-binding subunit YedZ
VTNPAVWYLMRGSGIVSLLMLTLVVALGIATAQRCQLGRLPRFVTTGLHRNASLLAVSFLALHVLLAVVDPDASVGVVSVVLPFVAGASAFWVGLGAIALDLVAAIVVTSLGRRRLSQAAWRRVHLCAYAAWPVAWLHGFGMGTDRATPWMAGVDILCLLAVAAAVAWRLAAIAETAEPRRTTA